MWVKKITEKCEKIAPFLRNKWAKTLKIRSSKQKEEKKELLNEYHEIMTEFPVYDTHNEIIISFQIMCKIKWKFSYYKI